MITGLVPRPPPPSPRGLRTRPTSIKHHWQYALAGIPAVLTTLPMRCLNHSCSSTVYFVFLTVQYGTVGFDLPRHCNVSAEPYTGVITFWPCSQTVINILACCIILGSTGHMTVTWLLTYGLTYMILHDLTYCPAHVARYNHKNISGN